MSSYRLLSSSPYTHHARQWRGRLVAVIVASTGLAGIVYAGAGLDSVLWMQTAAEYRASARQAYGLATIRLNQGLADRTWTAAVEQWDRSLREPGTYDYTQLPPAIILDVDETVLDNSPYQAWLVREGRDWDRASWNQWCERASARALPGVSNFLSHAKQTNVAVFFVTNREHAVEKATIENLRALGFDAGGENVLTNGEQNWNSDKGSRRAWIAETHRILLLIGDNLGDFIDGYKTTPVERCRLVEMHSQKWGKHWIVIPNPSYGSWERALYDFRKGLSGTERLGLKRDRLRTMAWR